MIDESGEMIVGRDIREVLLYSELNKIGNTKNISNNKHFTNE